MVSNQEIENLKKPYLPYVFEFGNIFLTDYLEMKTATFFLVRWKDKNGLKGVHKH